jgi:transposase
MMPAQPFRAVLPRPRRWPLLLFTNMSTAHRSIAWHRPSSALAFLSARGALGHWVIGSSEKHLVRIYDALKQRLLSQDVIHGDETTVQVLKEKDRKQPDESYIWAYRSGQDSLEPVALLEYQPGRGQMHPRTFLGDYRGILMSDGYQAWRTLKGATHVGCMAHARRRFVNAFKVGKKQSGPSEQALKLFDQLYRIERQVRDEKGSEQEQAEIVR